MGLENLALVNTGDFPIRHEGEVHNGKVRSVYWLSLADSQTLAHSRNYHFSEGSQAGIMIISDRVTAFDVPWQGEDGLSGIPGKGAALNAVSHHWFNQFDKQGLARNHILEAPHPLVWIVQRARPILIEAIARQYITGSMWRDYNEKRAREFCGIQLPDGLKEHQKLAELIITPTTKGILKGIAGVPEEEDTNLTRRQIIDNYEEFGFNSPDDVDLYEHLLRQGFESISRHLESIGQIFVDTKFEFGYVRGSDGSVQMRYIDEVGTPDSSRIWDAALYNKGKVVEKSKEGFRQFLLANTDRDVLLDKKRMPERRELARKYRVPVSQVMEVADTYRGIAEKITGGTLPRIEDARREIMDVMSRLGLAA